MKRKPMKRVKMWAVCNSVGKLVRTYCIYRKRVASVWAQPIAESGYTIRRVIVTEITPNRRKVK